MTAQYGTAEEAKAMLEKAVAAVKENKAKALDMFNKGEGGFKDRDLYVYSANASDGIFTAHPTLKGKHLGEIKGKHGAPLGETIMQNATEGMIKETTYWWPRPGSDKPLEKTTFYTKAGDQICAVGYLQGVTAFVAKRARTNYLICLRGDVAERLKAAVC